MPKDNVITATFRNFFANLANVCGADSGSGFVNFYGHFVVLNSLSRYFQDTKPKILLVNFIPNY